MDAGNLKTKLIEFDATNHEGLRLTWYFEATGPQAMRAYGFALRALATGSVR